MYAQWRPQNSGKICGAREKWPSSNQALIAKESVLTPWFMEMAKTGRKLSIYGECVPARQLKLTADNSTNASSYLSILVYTDYDMICLPQSLLLAVLMIPLIST